MLLASVLACACVAHQSQLRRSMRDDGATSFVQTAKTDDITDTQNESPRGCLECSVDSSRTPSTEKPRRPASLSVCVFCTASTPKASRMGERAGIVERNRIIRDVMVARMTAIGGCVHFRTGGMLKKFTVDAVLDAVSAKTVQRHGRKRSDLRAFGEVWHVTDMMNLRGDFRGFRKTRLSHQGDWRRIRCCFAPEWW